MRVKPSYPGPCDGVKIWPFSDAHYHRILTLERLGNCGLHLDTIELAASSSPMLREGLSTGGPRCWWSAARGLQRRRGYTFCRRHALSRLQVRGDVSPTADENGQAFKDIPHAPPVEGPLQGSDAQERTTTGSC